MAKTNRDWKTFGRRWDASRFEKFIFWSVIVHLGIAVGFGVSAYLARQERERLKEEQRFQEAKARVEKEEAIKEADEEVQELLKEELVQEQLRDFYEELVEEFLDPKKLILG